MVLFSLTRRALRSEKKLPYLRDELAIDNVNPPFGFRLCNDFKHRFFKYLGTARRQSLGRLSAQGMFLQPGIAGTRSWCRIGTHTKSIQPDPRVIQTCDETGNLGIVASSTPSSFCVLYIMAASERTNYESLACRHWRDVYESGARVVVCLERVRATAGKRVWLDPSANLLGVHDRHRDVRVDIHFSRTHSRQAWSPSMCTGRGAPGLAGILSGQHDDIAALFVRRVWSDRRCGQRIRLCHTDSRRIEVVSGQTRPRCRADGRRLRRELRDYRSDGDTVD